MAAFSWFVTLALGKLLTAPRLMKTNFLALYLSCIPGNQPRLAEYRLERCIVIDQCSRDAMSDRTGLTRLPTTINVNQNVKGIKVIGQYQRLTYDHATGLARKKIIDRLVIDDYLPFTGLDENTRNRALAAAGAIVVLDCHVIP